MWSIRSDRFCILRAHPQSSHSLSTTRAQPRPTCPHGVETALAGAALRCLTVSQTPTYDQLRGERINADVPASEADPQVDHPGKHRLREDAPTVVVDGSPPGPVADLVEDWSWFGTREPVQVAPANAAPRVLVPPPAHARDRQQHRALGASHEAKTDSLATMLHHGVGHVGEHRHYRCGRP
jgi:hypothetical protein